MKKLIFLLIGLIVLIVLSGCLNSNPDEYERTSFDTHYDKNCEIVGEIVLERLNVHYPHGFICSSFLVEESYPSKSKCSCYRGKIGETEVITYYGGSGEVIKANQFVKYKSHPIRVKLYCNKSYVGCNIGDEETWNNDGCTVPLVEVEEYVIWLPCTGFLEAGEEYCRYSDEGHFNMNIPFIKNYAKIYDCEYEYIYEGDD